MPAITSARQRAGLTDVLPRQVQEFLRTETGGGAVLLAATAAALVWANSPWPDSYASVWQTKLTITLGGAELSHDLRGWINEGLMALFFFVVALEIRREFDMGSLRQRGSVTLPALAAIGGMVLPAGLYLLLNAGGPGANGWAIPIATDIAFALGVVGLLGSRSPPQLRVLLLTIAVVDDIGAIAVIAIAYTDQLHAIAILVSALAFLAILGLRGLRIWSLPLNIALGLTMWVAMSESGIHPTITGVLLGLAATAWPPAEQDVSHAGRLTRLFEQEPSPARARSAKLGIELAMSHNERLQHVLHPWTSYLVVPLFALANAGVKLDSSSLERSLSSEIALAIVVGLLLGKMLGVTGASLLAQRLGLGSLPSGIGVRSLLGTGAVAGIGFTVSLFVAELAFPGSPLQEEAKVGVLAGSLSSAVLGWLILAPRAGSPDPGSSHRPGAPGTDDVPSRRPRSSH
jgi:NhaA family Na+:H+ antiporter